MTIINPIDPVTFEPQQYSIGDRATIPTLDVNPKFTQEGGKVESAIFGIDNNLIYYNPEAKFSTIENSNSLLVYPGEEVTSLEFSQGQYFVLFNFINNELNSSFNQRFRIKEISANRKEVRLTAGFLTEEELEEAVNKFYPPQGLPETYPDFHLNFGEGNLVIANNILFDGTGDQYSILVKLYKPLPAFVEIDGDTNPWICTVQKETVGYSVEFEQEIIPVKTTVDLKGPNFSLDLNNQIHTSTKLTSYNELNLPSGLDSSSYSSSYFQLQNILEKKGIEVNIDYTNFENFIHFSSAEERVKNFFYKVELLQELGVSASSQTTYNSGVQNATEGKIENIIKNFDGFEYWMYYNSSSDSALTSSFPTPYPKNSLNGLPPFKFYHTSSTTVYDWYENAIQSASEYDRENIEALVNTVPSFIVEDSDNEKYLRFVKMIGQHFDTLFTYIQDINNRYNADNRLDFGISKDLVGEAIKSMGINLYSGNFTGASTLSSLVGINSGSGGINFLPTLEDGADADYITNYVTSSDFPTPIEDVNKEIYKRIYHNLPLLLKQKGSIAGVRTLINCFGIPEEVLDVKEFDIRYKGFAQNLPSVDASQSISFTTKSIVLPPTGTNYISPNLLSPSVRVQQDYVKDDSYDRDLHYTEIGFSPQGYIDRASHISFDPLDSDFPDFNDFYLGNDQNYYSSKFITGPQGSGQTVTWDTSFYIRYISFFDTSLFQMLKDFVPARNSTATGVIIKPTVKERQRQKPAQLTYENKTYNGEGTTEGYDWGDEAHIFRAIGQYDGRNVAERIAGTGGSCNNLNAYGYSDDDGGDWKGEDSPLVLSMSQVVEETVHPTLGYTDKYTNQVSIVPGKTYNAKKNRQEEYYNGEFSQTGQSSTTYTSKEFRQEGTDTGLFTYDNNPDNFYKKPQDTIVENLSLIKVNNLIDAITNAPTKNIIYNPNFQTIHIEIGVGDPELTENLLLSLGDTLHFSSSNGGFSYNVGPGTVLDYVHGRSVAFSAFPAYLTDDALFQEQTSIDLLLPFNPDSESWERGPWSYNEYNPLINNTQGPHIGRDKDAGLRKSVFYQRAEYSPSSENPLSPLGIDLLGSGSAVKAAVQDSNYECRWWNNSRYLGNRHSSLDFNRKVIKANVDTSFTFSDKNLGFEPYNPVTRSFNPNEGGGSVGEESYGGGSK